MLKSRTLFLLYSNKKNRAPKRVRRERAHGRCWHYFANHKLALASAIVCALFLLLAIGVEIYSIYCAHQGLMPVYAIENPLEIYSAPSFAHWCGTDYLGRDVWLRAVAGSATAVKVGTIAGLLVVFIGVTLGVLGGYFGGKIDALVVWIYSTFASMPTLLFILAFALLVSRGFLSPRLSEVVNSVSRTLNADPGMMAVYLAIGLTGWVGLCRVVRAETMKLKTMPYVEAAKVVGCTNFSIIVKQIVPNLFHLVIIYFTLRFAAAIMTEVIVSYLGFGVQSAPSWGVMIANGQERLWRGVWWEVVTATGFMFVLVLALNLLGDALRDLLDPRQKID